jgi:hypothetical protein
MRWKMDFIENVNELAAKIQREKDSLSTEEATKTAWIMPFINMLGYNVFSPSEVIPEFTADVGVKKGEKVDYCIRKDEQPIILVECKPHSAALTIEQASQLFRYFTVTKVRFAVLTNGIVYRFFADLEKQNVMDSKPFFEFDFENYSEASVTELKKFSKDSFDLEQILATASELKYTREIKKILNEQMSNPSDAFVRLLAGEVYTGQKSQKVITQFSDIVKRACQQIISDKISDRLKFALEEENTNVQPSTPSANNGDSNDEASKDGAGIVTTNEELEAFLTVRAILREKIDVNRVVMRDAKSYRSILLDNTNRKPICRLRFGQNKLLIGVLGADRNEATIQISDLAEMFRYADQFIAIVEAYETGKHLEAPVLM